jgi:hypothetical protein
MKKLLFSTLLFFGVLSVNAQSEMAELIRSGKADANLLLTEYAGPFLETFGNNLNNGWYSTAAPLKTGRFTISIGATASLVPTDKQSFTIDPTKYTNIRTKDAANNYTFSPIEAPTIFGSSDPVTGLYASRTNSVSGLTARSQVKLQGTGVAVSPFPVVQFSIGLIKGTEVMLRIFPKVKMGDNKAGFFGLGVKHDIKQWIPGLKDKPFDLSFIGAFTSAGFDVVGNDFLQADTAGISNPVLMDYSTQTISFSSTAWNLNVVISKKFSLLTVFGGVRLSHYKTTLEMKGNYPMKGYNDAGVLEVQNIVDPINIEGKGTKFGVNAGLRIKLGILAIFAEGSLVPGGYNSITGGLNIGLFN